MVMCSCSSNHRHEETTETSRIDPHTLETVERTRHTKTVTSDEDDGCGGIASCTVDFIGDVIAFPFRLVGGLVEAIF